MAFIHVCLWTLLTFVVTFTVLYVINRRKKATTLGDAVTEEQKDGSVDVIIVGAGVGGSALAYALAKVPPKLRKIFLKGIDEGAHIKVVPSKRMAATLSDKKGVIVLGDAFNMRHPVIASGMMVLLSDILILRRLLQTLSNLGDADKVSEVIKSFYNIRKPMSATVNTLGSAFSQVLFASTDEAKEAMRQGCYDYLSSGGSSTSRLMSLLGGMNPRPVSLVYHLCCITLSAIGHLLSPFPSPLHIWHCFRLFGISLKMLVPHLKAEGVSQMLFPTNADAYRKTYMTATVL